MFSVVDVMTTSNDLKSRQTSTELEVWFEMSSISPPAFPNGPELMSLDAVGKSGRMAFVLVVAGGGPSCSASLVAYRSAGKQCLHLELYS